MLCSRKQRVVINVQQTTQIPKIAINDEPAWTPQLSERDLQFTNSATNKPLIFVIILAVLITVTVGVVAGNIISNAVSNEDGVCQFTEIINNGICDSLANNVACNFDGADCCDSVDQSQYLLFCKDCVCLNKKDSATNNNIKTTANLYSTGFVPNNGNNGNNNNGNNNNGNNNNGNNNGANNGNGPWQNFFANIQQQDSATNIMLKNN